MTATEQAEPTIAPSGIPFRNSSGMSFGKLSDSNPRLALQITDYSYFETHILPLSVRHKKFFIIYLNI